MTTPYRFVCISVLLSLIGCQEVESGLSDAGNRKEADLPNSIEVTPLFAENDKARHAEIVSIRPLDESTLGFLELVNSIGNEQPTTSALNFGTFSFDGTSRRIESKESTWFLNGSPDEQTVSAWGVTPSSESGQMEFNLKKYQLSSNHVEVGVSQNTTLNPLLVGSESILSKSESLDILKNLESYYLEREFIAKYRLAGQEFRLNGSPYPFLWFVLDKESFILDSNSGKQHYLRPLSLNNSVGPRIAFCHSPSAKAFFAMIGDEKDFSYFSSYISDWKEMKGESRQKLVVVSFDGSQLRYEFSASVPQNLDYAGSMVCAGDPDSAIYVSAPTAPSEDEPSKIWIKGLIREGANAQLLETQVLSTEKSLVAGLRHSPKHKRVLVFGRAGFNQASTGSVTQSKGFVLLLDSQDFKASRMTLINGKRSVSINDANIWDSQNGAHLVIAGKTNAPDTHDPERGAAAFIHKLSLDLPNNNNLKGKSP